MVRSPKLKGGARKVPAKKQAAKADAPEKKKTSRFDLQHALDPLAVLLKGAVLRPDTEPKPPVAKKAPAPKKAPLRSPLAPRAFPELPPIDGVGLASKAAGVRYKGRLDLLVAGFQEGTTAAGVFTKSATAAAPVDVCRSNLDANGGGTARALIVNAGNANAFTGKAGTESVKAVVQEAARVAKCRQRDVFVASTGVIGEPLPYERITENLPGLYSELSRDAWFDAAQAIMTTDTFPKAATATAKIDGVPVTINGIAKGSGMIAPDMATMLAFLFTDAAIPGDVLQTLLFLGTRDTFNAITVDSDTSTNDAVMIFATGAAAGQPKISRAGDKRLADFRRKLYDVMLDLALQIVRDGEGASKLIRVDVSGAANAKSAKTIAMAIANSPLVKTAVAGEDPNWGRIVMAVGKSGEEANRDKLGIKICGVSVARDGRRDPKYDEERVAKQMKAQDIVLAVDVGVGSGAATVWTCDLTHGYISINADYRS